MVYPQYTWHGARYLIHYMFSIRVTKTWFITGLSSPDYSEKASLHTKENPALKTDTFISRNSFCVWNRMNLFDCAIRRDWFQKKMNLNNLIRVLSIVCVCIFVEPKAHKGNRCRKFYKQLSAEFDKRFRSLEKKLILQQDVTPNSTRSYRDLVLNSNESLERLKNQIRSQKRSMDNLNGHFGVLENVVKNLTEAIDRLGNMSPPKTVQPAAPEVVTTPAITVSAKTTPEPKRGFPKRKFFYFFKFFLEKVKYFITHKGMMAWLMQLLPYSNVIYVWYPFFSWWLKSLSMLLIV